MAAHGITAHTSTKPSRRRNIVISGLMVRMLLALIISWLIVMAFFVTNVVSH